MLIVASIDGTVLLLSEWAMLLATRFLKDGGSILQSGANLGLGIWIMLLICVQELSAEAGGWG